MPCMPGRKTPIVTGEIYHVFNRGINRQLTFTDKKEYRRALETIFFYRFTKPPVRLAVFRVLTEEKQAEILELIEKGGKQVEIICFCLMPNHFHLLLKQTSEGGISKFLSRLQNSFTRYFNIKHKRDGSLFLDQFKAVRVENNEQLLHLSRYIHLNPYTGFVVKTLEELTAYPWSSLSYYLRPNRDQLVKSSLVLDSFKSTAKYRKFVFDQAGYQRELNRIAHLALE